MAAGRVEAMRVPVNCLDVLAQQVIAMVAMDKWNVTDLYRCVRQAYPYRDLTPKAFDAVLEMVSGRFRLTGLETAATNVPTTDRRVNPATALSALQPRI